MPKSLSRRFVRSPEYQQVLRKIAITDTGPGTILRDFDVLLEFVGEGGLPVTGTHLLPSRVLPEIDARLTHPLQLRLKRPQQKSYPHINGLYLLARASGLTRVVGSEKKLRLCLDKEIHQSWYKLNPTERYCTLLESWFLRGQPGIIGDSDRIVSLMLHTLKDWDYFFEGIPDKGLPIGDNTDAQRLLRFQPGWYTLALLELFGLIKVNPGSPVEGQNWSIESICRTPFGDALLALLFAEYFADWDLSSELERDGKARFGVLQPMLQPYLTNWKSNLAVPEWVFREGTHIFKVSLGRTWHRIAIPADCALDALAYAILDAVDFDYDHLYLFSYRNRFGAVEEIVHSHMDDGPRAEDTLVGELPLPVGQAMTFLYDFGDEWEFDVTLEEISPKRTDKKPVLLESHGEPPEQYSSWEE